MARTKQYRRDQEAKHYNKRVKYKKAIGPDDINDKARNYYLKDTGSPCSCHLCCNPRHSKLYKGKEKLTIQERRHNS